MKKYLKKMSTKTIIIVAGGLLVVGGVTLYLLYRKNAAAAPQAGIDASLLASLTSSTKPAADPVTPPVTTGTAASDVNRVYSKNADISPAEFCAMPNGVPFFNVYTQQNTKIGYIATHGGFPPLATAGKANQTSEINIRLQQWKEEMGCP